MKRISKQKGVTLIEYIVLAAVLIVGVITALTALQGRINNKLGAVQVAVDGGGSP